MFKKIKKYLLVIPCMVFGMFLFSNIDVSANEAKLLRSTPVYVGDQTKSNRYYFSNDFLWEFQVEGYDAILDGDAFVKWRVVNPAGMATSWQGSIKDTRYVDNGGKFSIKKYNELAYTQNVGLSGRDSVAPGSTYYVDIQYYTFTFWSSHSKEKDETIKIVVGANVDGAAYIPSITVDYEKASRNFSIAASLTDDNGKGTGVVTSLKYFFSTQKEDGVGKSAFSHSLPISYGNNVTASLQNVDESAEYLYVLAESGNGYYTILEYDIDNEVTTDTDDDKTPESNEDDESDKGGLFDYRFGEIILIVLVIVLVVSCALIITQKIVDYKKRLY